MLEERRRSSLHSLSKRTALIKQADVNLCMKDSTGPLYIACQNGHESTAQLLLKNGAEVNLSIEDGSTPLDIACFDGHESTAQFSLQRR